MTIKEIIIKYCRELENISDTPRLDVELLLKRALGDVDSMYIRMYLDKELSEDQEKYFLEMMKDRLNQRPIAYILGNREFMGLDFFVKEGVLIPRPDTETLVEEIINICNNKTGLNILDIGTGSGAITVSLAKYLDKSHIVSVDISDIALEIASKNAVSNKVDERIDFIKSDVFSNVSRENKFDIIVSNPPYIKKSDIDGLDRQVKDFEPYNALEGGEDGLDFYRKITRESREFLNENGILAYEVGHDQASDVSKIMQQNGFKGIYTKSDLQGFERVVIGFYNN
ncbi:MAG: peptide chain release factor N(5)-glutamine methyltransferase [Intestinibacter sp.]|uniref:peptide chain release factor N(5)-glutamine methyltransferase n=1 Tax=Intestinibacter sp. TaxID=1965304 RepID=UPI0025C3E917|nr:peptide chain release factor N(5)-glutamine methyltransferase [Intestinibacter sp.]MCI6737271.1 peptide chain release factor N(5)-glutamine methyltransferase [Intestinibacter sp.]